MLVDRVCSPIYTYCICTFFSKIFNSSSGQNNIDYVSNLYNNSYFTRIDK